MYCFAFNFSVVEITKELFILTFEGKNEHCLPRFEKNMGLDCFAYGFYKDMPNTSPFFLTLRVKRVEKGNTGKIWFLIMSGKRDS